MKSYIIDRFEGAIAVLEEENGEICDIDKKLLPENACEGDAVTFDGEHYCVDKAVTMQRKKAIEEKMRRIMGK